jgi:thiol-disulfide isomerase/thioredoxin
MRRKPSLLGHALLLSLLASPAFSSPSFAGDISRCEPTSPESKVKSRMPNPPELLGPVKRPAIDALDWMEKGYAKALAEIKTSFPREKIQAAFEGTQLKVYLGSWCSDSHEYVPVFLALADYSGLPQENVSFVALDQRKTHPGFKNEWNVTRLPTFIFFRDGRESGRITESPKTSIPVDSLEVLDRTNL